MAKRETPNENTVRAKAQRMGYSVHKSRQRTHVPNLDNHGEYMLVDADRNAVVLGERYDATLDDIWRWLEKQS